MTPLKPFIIAVLNQKGGSGKTTLATNLGYSFLLDYKRVLLVDADPQGSARDWRESNPSCSLPVIGLDRETISKDLDAVSSSYDLVIIDGAPQLEKMSVAVVKIADLIIIPVQPSPYDIWACADLVDIIKARQDITEGKPRAVFIISRLIRNTKLSQEISNALEEYGFPVLKASTAQRIIYPTSAAEGKTVFDESLTNPAACEILAIRKELEDRIYGS
jgi:chromosome partitioning protein